MDQTSVSTEPGLEIGPVNCGKLLNCNEFMKYVVQIVNKERRSLKKKLLLLLLLLLVDQPRHFKLLLDLNFSLKHK